MVPRPGTSTHDGHNTHHPLQKPNAPQSPSPSPVLLAAKQGLTHRHTHKHTLPRTLMCMLKSRQLRLRNAKHNNIQYLTSKEKWLRVDIPRRLHHPYNSQRNGCTTSPCKRGQPPRCQTASRCTLRYKDYLDIFTTPGFLHCCINIQAPGQSYRFCELNYLLRKKKKSTTRKPPCGLVPPSPPIHF